MFEKLRQSKLLFWSVELLVLATFVFVLTKVDFLLKPLGVFFSTLFAPILVSGFLYYMLNPLVELLTEKLKVKRIFAIVFVFLLLIGALVLIIMAVIPNLIKQLTQLAANIPDLIQQIEVAIKGLSKNDALKHLDLNQELAKLNLSYGMIIQKFMSGVAISLGSVFSTIASAAMLLITVPFILFYMLKDGHRALPNILRLVSEKRKESVANLLKEMNRTLANYISGQMIECIFVGTFTFLGYLIFGIKYAFLLGVIAGITNLVPYLGPYLGLLPAIVVTIFNNPVQALICCGVVLVVQQIDSNVIYPNVIGKSLSIHPLTIIIILLVAGNLAGLLGIFLGVPLYAIARTIIAFAYRMAKE